MTKNNQPPLIHVGYMKCASTFLQKNVFDSSSLRFQSPLDRKDYLTNLMMTHPLALDLPKVKEEINLAFDKIQSEDVVPVISSEGFAGNIHVGGFNAHSNLDILHNLFPNGKVLIIIREQTSYVLSAYQQYIKAGGALRLEDYLNYPCNGRIRGLNHDYLRYHFLIEYVQKTFGADNTLVLPMEMLKKDTKGFVERIVNFAHESEEVLESLPKEFFEKTNASFSLGLLGLKRIINKYFIQNDLNPEPMFRFGIKQNNRVMAFIWKLNRFFPKKIGDRQKAKMLKKINKWADGQFEISNARSAELIKTNLTEYGYH